jgi:hypothetical protein
MPRRDSTKQRKRTRHKVEQAKAKPGRGGKIPQGEKREGKKKN